jgi:imidazole glycerol-phosphate synthase subunit HisH
LIAILDYGSGNLRSAQRAFELTGHEVEITADRDHALAADGLVVPGVGAFGACMDQLRSIGGEEIIRAKVESGKPILGICVGMQILFSRGIEKGTHSGVGVFSGEVTPLEAPVLPHIGWNTVSSASNSILFRGIENESFYFVHSYAVKGVDSGILSSITEYGERFIAAVEDGNVSATQFHPEKSGEAGATLIKNWVETL